MATKAFFYLDSIGVNPSLLDPASASTSTLNDELVYRSQLNQAVNSVQVEARFADLISGLQLINPKVQTKVSVREVNRLVETFLCVLFCTPTILSLDQRDQTPHYLRRKQVTSRAFLSTDAAYSEELLFSSNRTWGSSYGSFGYLLHLSKEREHYLHPSQLIDKGIQQLSLLHRSTPWDSFFDQLRLLSLSESESADADLYRLLNRLWIDSGFQDLVRFLEFLEKEIPPLLTAYFNLYRTNQALPSSLSSSEKVAFKIVNLILQYGFDESSFTNLVSAFGHQSILPAFFQLTEEIISLRQVEVGPGLPVNEWERFTQALFTQIPRNLSPSALRTASYELLDIFCPPGGYNLLLVSLSLALLNRAYILTHSSQTIYSDDLVFPIESSDSSFLSFIGRILRLIALAGFTLSNSNLDHLKIYGDNLLTFTNLNS